MKTEVLQGIVGTAGIVGIHIHIHFFFPWKEENRMSFKEQMRSVLI